MGACISKTKAGVAAAKDKAVGGKNKGAATKDAPKDAAKDAPKTAADTSEQPAAEGDTTAETAKDVVAEVKETAAETEPKDAVVAAKADTDEAKEKAEVEKKEEVKDKDVKMEDVEIVPDTKVEDAAVTPAETATDTPAEPKATESAEPATVTSSTSDGFAALMAGTLEAVRAGIEECTSVSTSGTLRSFGVSFSALTLAIRNEMVIEEEAYFPLIDLHFSDLAKTSNLYAAHREDEKLEKLVDDALSKAKDLPAAVEAFGKWREHHLAHIDRELDVLGAPFGELPGKLGDKAANIFNEKVLAPRMEEIMWFVTWNVSMLRKFKSFEALADWVHALRRISTTAQWAEIEKAAFEKLAEEDRVRLRESFANVNTLA